MKSKIILIVSILIGVAAFWLTASYLRNETRKIQSRLDFIDVVVAARDLTEGAILSARDLARDSIPKQGLSDRPVMAQEFEQIIGKKILFTISRGNAILWSDVGVKDRRETGLAETVSTGLRAVSIGVDSVASVSSLVKPMDRVDLLGTFTFPSDTRPNEVEMVTLTVLQDVTVLAVGQTMGKRSGGNAPARGYSTMTFEVTPNEAELLAFLQSTKGRIMLSLRNPNDVSFETNLPSVNFEHLQKSLPEMNLTRQRDIRHKRL